MEFRFKAKVHATKEAIWDFYANVEKWYAWEDNLEDITLNGSFQTGTVGMMKLAGMSPLEFTLTNVVENQAFCDETRTPFGDLYFNHEIIEENDGVYIQHSVGINTDEPTPEQLGFLRQVFSDVPDSILKLKAEVEK